MEDLIVKLEEKYNSIVYLSTKSENDVVEEPIMDEKPYGSNKNIQSILESK